MRLTFWRFLTQKKPQRSSYKILFDGISAAGAEAKAYFPGRTAAFDGINSKVANITKWHTGLMSSFWLLENFEPVEPSRANINLRSALAAVLDVCCCCSSHAGCSLPCFCLFAYVCLWITGKPTTMVAKAAKKQRSVAQSLSLSLCRHPSLSGGSPGWIE